MKKHKWLSMFTAPALALALAACGTGEGDASGDEDAETSGESSEDMEAAVMEPKIEQLDEDTYRYTLANQTKETVTFEFTSGQRFDFSLTDENEEQVFLLSSVSAYIQALGEETLAPGEELNYEFDVPELNLAEGSYELKAWLTPKEGPAYRTETEYIVEEN